MIVKQILLIFSTIILAVIGLPHDLNYKEKYDNLESHSFAPVSNQDKVQSVLKTLRSKEKLNLKPCSRRFNSDGSLDSDQLIQTSSHLVVIPYESLDSNRMDSQKNYAPNKNKVQYFDNEDFYKAFLQVKSTENEQKSKPVTRAGENIVNYVRSPKKNKESVTSNYEPKNLSQRESADISEVAQPIQSPFRVLKSQHVSVEDAYDTLESLARVASPSYDSAQREITAYYPSKSNYEKMNKTLPLLNHNPKNVRNPINRGQNIDNSLSMQENDENYDAIAYALEMEMAEKDMRSEKNNQNEKYNPKVFENIAKLLSIYEQNNEEQELPSKARLVVNPDRNTLKAQSLKKIDDTLEDTESIQDDQNSVKNNLSNLRSKANAEQYPKTYEESYVNQDHVANNLKSQSFKHNNDNEESSSQESSLTKESEEYEIDLKSVENNLRNSHSKNKIESVIITPKDYFNNQKDSNSDSVQSYKDMNSELRSGEDSNYFSESEQDLSSGVSHELKKSQVNDKNSNISSSRPNNGLIFKVSPLIKDSRHLFNTELPSNRNSSQEVEENRLNYYSSPPDSHLISHDIEDLSESKSQKSNSRHQINSPVPKVSSSLKDRKVLSNDDNINQSSSQEEEDSLQYSSSSHISHDEDNKSNLSDKRVSGRYQHKVQVPEIRIKKKTQPVNDQVSNHKSPNQNLIDQNLTQENSQDSSPNDSHHQNYDIEDLSESLENKVQMSNSRHQINSPVSKVATSLKSRKQLLTDNSINVSSSKVEEDSPRSSHKSRDEDNKPNLSDYQENEDKRVSGRYQHKVQVPEIRVKEKTQPLNDQVSNHKSPYKNLYDQNLTQEVEDNSKDYHSSLSDSHRQNYDIKDLSESLENKVQKSNSRHQINNPVSKVTTSLKSRKQLLNDNSINLSSSQEEEDNLQYRSSHKFHDDDNKSNLSDYEDNEDKRISGHYLNKAQVPEIRVKEKKHFVNDQVSRDESLNQEAELNNGDTNENSSKENQKLLIYSVSNHKSQLKNNDNSQSDNLSRSLENKNFNSPNQNSQIKASVKRYQKLKKEVEQRPLYRSNVPNSQAETNNNNLILSNTQENVENNSDARDRSTVSLAKNIVRDEDHLINDELSSDQLSSQETEESQHYRGSPHKPKNHNDSQNDNLIESGENIYNSLKSRQQDSQVAVVKNSNLKSKYEAKKTSQYHSGLPEVHSTRYDNYLNTFEIQKSEGKSSDDGYKQKKSQTIQEIAKDAITYNDINEEGGNRENINNGYVVNSFADNLINGDRENFHSINDNTPNVDISSDHNSGLRNGYLDNIKGSTCLDRLDLSTDYDQSNEALPSDDLAQNDEIDLRTGNNEQLDEDESQNDDDGCIKDKIKISKNEILNSASRRFFNNYLEEEHQDQEDEEEKADADTEETEATEEIDERDVEESEQQNSEPQYSLFDPSIGKGVREFSESRMLLSESSRLVCYACSTLSDPTCWAPDGKTTVKYCQRGYDSCIQRTYEGKDALIMVRDCAISCEGETVPGLSLKYKTCEVCQSDLCNSAYTALNSLNLMVMLGAIAFVKYVF